MYCHRRGGGVLVRGRAVDLARTSPPIQLLLDTIAERDRCATCYAMVQHTPVEPVHNVPQGRRHRAGLPGHQDQVVHPGGGYRATSARDVSWRTAEATISASGSASDGSRDAVVILIPGGLACLKTRPGATA